VVITLKKILIIEDDESIHNVIEELLKKENYDTYNAYSGTEALLLLEKEKYDLILLDLMLPGLKGEEIIGKVKDTQIIVLSAKSGLENKVTVLSAGAEDYICKPFDLQELLVRIQVQLRRQAKNSPGIQADDTIYQYREWTLNPATLEMSAGKFPIELTKHEFLILELLIRNPKRIFSKQMIYEYAWGEEYLAEDKTINVHISNIRTKLKESGTDAYIQTVWGMGFKLS